MLWNVYIVHILFATVKSRAACFCHMCWQQQPIKSSLLFVSMFLRVQFPSQTTRRASANKPRESASRARVFFLNCGFASDASKNLRKHCLTPPFAPHCCKLRFTPCALTHLTMESGDADQNGSKHNIVAKYVYWSTWHTCICPMSTNLLITRTKLGCQNQRF